MVRLGQARVSLLARLLAWLRPGRAAPPQAPAAAQQTAAEFVAQWEGFVAKPYLCPAGVATIGFGSTRYPSGQAVTMDDPSCTREQALAWLAHDIADAEAAVRLYVQVPLTDGARIALTSFVYNVGAGAFSNSTLRRLLNSGDTAGAAEQFGKWVFANGARLPGLVKRRAAEAALFAG
jgi:lysozyme